MRDQRGSIAVIGIIGLVAVVGLFVAYVTGHSLHGQNKKVENTPPVAVIQVTPAAQPETK